MSARSFTIRESTRFIVDNTMPTMWNDVTTFARIFFYRPINFFVTCSNNKKGPSRKAIIITIVTPASNFFVVFRFFKRRHNFKWNHQHSLSYMNKVCDYKSYIEMKIWSEKKIIWLTLNITNVTNGLLCSLAFTILLGFLAIRT